MHHQVQENCDPVISSTSSTLVIIDSSIDDYQSMLEDLRGRHYTYVLSAEEDGIIQVTDLLNQLETITSLHIVSHGSPGTIFLGNRELSVATLTSYAPQLKTWFPSISDASLALYGCNVAVGDAGEEFLRKLHVLTQADIAASTTSIGQTKLGGNWDLDYRLGTSGTVLFSEHFQQSYASVLATPVTNLFTTTADATPTTIVSDGVGDPASEFAGDTTYTTRFGRGDDIILTGFEVNIGGVIQTFSTELGGLTLDSAIKIQRNTANADANTPFFALQSDPRPDPLNDPQYEAEFIDIIGSEVPDDDAALNGDIINRGIEAVFVNEGQSASNIERLDYILTTPVRTTDANELDSVGFLIVERGGNDSFQIAPILALDANNDPTAYGDLITVNANDFGATDQEILAVQYTQEMDDPNLRPDNIFNRGGSTQNIGAVYISWDDLGIDVNENVFGYSLFAPDTNPANGDLLDVNSGAFPTNTTGRFQGSGNSLDPIAGGLLFVSDTVDDLVSIDTDQDGVDDVIDLDDDNDGILDVDEGADDNRDTDGDGIPDYLDIDSDNDGIPDNVEAQTTAGYRAPIPDGPGADTNDNGINDAYDPDIAGSTPLTIANLVNTDDDPIPDYLDPDSDNDGIPDAAENNETANAIVDPNADADGDGLNDVFDSVDNSNGTWDVNDDIDTPSTDLPNTDGNDADVDYRTAPIPVGDDADQDGIPDIEDLDDDNDGILDTVEDRGVPNRDTDGDGIPDRLDLDADNDGILDIIEAGHTEADPDGDGRVNTPVGANGFADGLETTPESGSANYTVADTDNEGVPDFQDLDSDNDGLLDVTEGGSQDPDEDGLIGVGVPTVNDAGIANDINPAVGGTSAPVPDTDGNGTPDFRSLDSDSDTIPDLEESGINAPDENNDGVVDGPDTDGDGIVNPVDRAEGVFGTAPGDSDGDGIPDSEDIDDDNDGILDTVEERGVPGRDTDGDGVPDSRDLDTDNDGILDVVEAGLIAQDPDGDGRVDGPFGDNGFADDLETAPESGVPIFTPRDTDGDTLPDFQDLDADNDSIPDVVESGGSDPDEDGIIGSGTPVVNENGVANDINPAVGGTPSPIPNTDGTDQPDYQDIDSNNDGINDLVTVGGSILDPDGNGQVDGVDADEDGITDTVDRSLNQFGTGPAVDTDEDTIIDIFDLDDDNDGILDEVEEGGDPLKDTDGDGILDRLDLDADNDGILDIVEAGHTEGDADGNGRVDTPVGTNGFADGLETAPDSNTANFTPVDTDVEGVFDFQDLDADNDGILDVVEGGNADPDEDGLLGNGTPTLGNSGVDANGIPTARQVPTGSSFNLPSIDLDNVFDFRDLDSDGDGIFDLIEGEIIAPDANNDGVVDGLDSDGDGIVDPIDRRQGIFGTAPARDTDDDGVPDAIDLDDDNDGILDVVEENGTPGRDTDGDGVPDSLDLDADNDGILDVVEAGHSEQDPDGDGRLNGPFGDNGFADILETTPESGVANFTAENTDSDGVPDFQDLDSDNDSIPDVTETDGSDPDQDGVIGTGTPVVNEDGIANDINSAVGGTPSPVTDTDSDTIPDYRDLDSDNDGIFDLRERGGIDLPENLNGQVIGVDSDGDGIVDTVDGNIGIFGTVPGLNPIPINSDEDDVPDYRDRPSIIGGEKVIGDDLLRGLSDPDKIEGRAGDNTIIGGSADDRLLGRGGDDQIIGGTGDDTISGGSGNDLLKGGGGDDKMRGNTGRDFMFGGSGSDTMFGGRGSDRMSGGSSRDRMLGGRGNDVISGDRGNDRIRGGRGQDTLTGGQGQDVFIFSRPNEIGDTITDFELTKDRIRLRKLNNGINAFTDLSIVQSGENALIQSQSGDLIVQLNTIEAADLNDSHFIF
ncbi:MAG: DUF4347 domain-containing protein [Cyanobacteria bacterium P01_F01_bin.150]